MIFCFKQVLNVNIQMQPDNTSLAFVLVASIDDARYAISQFHRKKIGYKRIHVALVDSSTSGADQAANTKYVHHSLRSNDLSRWLSMCRRSWHCCMCRRSWRCCRT